MRSRRRHARPEGLILAAALIFGSSLAAGVSLAQTRAPEQRRTLLQLADVLGQAHALRLVCAPDDQMWRARMRRLIEIETPDQAFEAELTVQFNNGFSRARKVYARCDASAVVALQRIAGEGKRLSRGLSVTP